MAIRNLSVEPENLSKMAPQLLDVVPDAADAEFAEIRQVLSDLRRIQVELVGQRLRRHRPYAGAVERIETAQIHGQPVRRQFGNRFGCLPPRVAARAAGPPRPRLVRLFHKAIYSAQSAFSIQQCYAPAMSRAPAGCRDRS